jgi:hypothetical protein
MTKPSEQQVGGNHYKDKGIQPIHYAHANQLNACQFSVVKYITRYANKDGLKDLLKAKHFIDLLIEIEYPEYFEQSPVTGIVGSISQAPEPKTFDAANAARIARTFGEDVSRHNEDPHIEPGRTDRT